jgi:gamma-glutamylcyclotransferase (GGCT)/AIG2-like uncharacterized protein YtfP
MLAAAAVFGGLWALYNYWGRRRVEAAHWIHELFREFYVADRYRDIKWRLVRPEEDQLLRDLDTLLNFFEHIMYLESQRHLRTRDRKAMFNYWLELLRAPEYAALRKYIARFDYERLAKTIEAVDIDYVAVYGTLRSDVSVQPRRSEPDLDSDAVFRGRCQIPGRLVDVGEHPGLIVGEGLVRGELLEATGSRALQELDAFEGYDPTKRAQSAFRRRLLRLVEPPVDAWVYVYARVTDGLPEVPDGDWKAYVDAKYGG